MDLLKYPKMMTPPVNHLVIKKKNRVEKSWKNTNMVQKTSKQFFQFAWKVTAKRKRRKEKEFENTPAFG